MKYKTIMVYEYNKRFLVVGGGSGSGSTASMGLHFPQEQLTWITPIPHGYYPRLCKDIVIIFF